jgi:hypothetical protein
MSTEYSKEFYDQNIHLINEIASFIRDENTDKLKSALAAHPELLHCNFFGPGKMGILNFAVMKGNLEICKLLVGMDVDIDACDQYKNTPLSEASTNGHVEIVKWLLESGANVDALPTSITTPLMDAIVMGHGEIAKYLIEREADINRLHVRLNQTPLDLAMIWGREDIAEILRSKSAISTSANTDWSKEYGGPIIQYVSDIAGRVLPIQLVRIVGEELVVGQRIALVNKGKNKFLFTVGLFAVHEPMLELFIVLPEYWNLHDRGPKNQFPSSLLLSISNQIRHGLKIEEGFCVRADDPVYSNLPWPTGIAGFCVCDHYWGRNREDKEEIPAEDKVYLLTLIPVKATKKGFPQQSIEKNRQAGWAKLTVNLE